MLPRGSMLSSVDLQVLLTTLYTKKSKLCHFGSEWGALLGSRMPLGRRRFVHALLMTRSCPT